MHGSNNANSCFLDAIRVGTTWAEVCGVETVGPPSVEPSNTVYEGTPLIFSVIANVSDTNATYQWLKGGGPILDETNSTYTILNPTTADSGGYSVIYSNFWGVAVTSQVQTLTVNPYTPH